MDTKPSPSPALQFSKEKSISKSLPAETWLFFIKKNILSANPNKFKPGCLLSILIIVIILGLKFTDVIGYEAMIGSLIFSIIGSIIVLAVVYGFGKSAFVHLPAFHHLARFLIHIKGDLKDNLIDLKMDLASIENDENALDLQSIGLKNTKTTKYTPYQMQRYFGSFNFKDGSFGAVSLSQITVKVRSTKRRSSGKVKTKIKHKHKLYYQLLLRLPIDTYQVVETGDFNDLSPIYSVSIVQKKSYHVVKIKQKEKLPYLVVKMKETSQNHNSYFTKMLKFLLEKKIIIPTSSKS